MKYLIAFLLLLTIGCEQPPNQSEPVDLPPNRRADSQKAFNLRLGESAWIHPAEITINEGKCWLDTEAQKQLCLDDYDRTHLVKVTRLHDGFELDLSSFESTHLWDEDKFERECANKPRYAPIIHIVDSFEDR